MIIEANHPANRQIKTLVHELGHGLVRADRYPDDPALGPAAEELVAETTAYSVCASERDRPRRVLHHLPGQLERAHADRHD